MWNFKNKVFANIHKIGPVQQLNSAADSDNVSECFCANVRYIQCKPKSVNCMNAVLVVRKCIKLL